MGGGGGGGMYIWVLVRRAERVVGVSEVEVCCLSSLERSMSWL